MRGSVGGGCCGEKWGVERCEGEGCVCGGKWGVEGCEGEGWFVEKVRGVREGETCTSHSF